MASDTAPENTVTLTAKINEDGTFNFMTRWNFAKDLPSEFKEFYRDLVNGIRYQLIWDAEEMADVGAKYRVIKATEEQDLAPEVEEAEVN